jgi:hypothetical protein
MAAQGMSMQEYAAGPNQLIVVYVSEDTGEMIDVDEVWASIAADAQARAAQGWRIVSTAGVPMRQMGTAGNILLQSGGQYATQATIAIVYALA